MVSAMILSRYFAKEDYGTYKQVLYVYNTLLAVFTLGLPKAFSYFLPRVSLGEAKDVVRKINLMLLVVGGVFSLCLFFFAPIIAVFLKNENLTIALRVFSPVPFLMLPTMGLEGILSTYRKTQISAIYTVLTRIFMLLCVALPVILFDGDYIQAITGFVIASFFSFLVALFMKNIPFKGIDKVKSKVTMKKIVDFSLPLMYASFWGIIITSADQFFISRYFGAEVFAEFANGALELPFVGMIVGATATVLSPVFSRMSHEKLDPKTEIYPLWISVFEKTIKLIYPLIIFCWFFADVIMAVLYGSAYAVSGTYFRIKLIVNLFTIIVYAPLIIAIGANRFYANVHLVHAIALIIFEYISILIFNSPFVILTISVVFRILHISILLLFISNYFRISFINIFPLKLIFKIILPSCIFLIFIRTLLGVIFLIDGIALLLLSFVFYLHLFFILSILVKIDYKDVFKPIFSIFKNKN